MKKILFFFICCVTLFSCTKCAEPPIPQQATGILHFSEPEADGAGLYFQTNGNSEYLYFYNDTGDQFLNEEGFKDSIGLHLRMTYLDEGRRGCPFCHINPGPQRRIVKLISLVKE